MKSLYITSVERYSGKTATCLAIGKRLLAAGYSVGYLKPLSLQPWRIAGHLADEDAAFVKEILQLELPAWELSPVVVTPEVLREHLQSQDATALIEQVQRACQSAGAGKDVLLLEGGASLREGYAVSLPTPAVADALDSQVLVILKYHDEVQILDDALASYQRLGPALKGILINRAPPEAITFLQQVAAPFLERRSIPVFGILPETRGLEALTIQELIDVLGAQVLTKEYRSEALVETLTVGAMTADAALSRFRKQTNKAVITGGDRTDIQLAALETSTTCLILTGNLHPSPLIVKQAEEFGVSVLLVPTNTMETVEAIEHIFGKTRLGQPSKLRQFEALLAEHFDLGRLYQALGLQA
ncbi:MAG: phosphotransacetylase family protein [Anaerolineales bacterium]|nr:MAG: phosphotransacetylase family protein [Anaerolineales bacterium]